MTVLFSWYQEIRCDDHMNVCVFAKSIAHGKLKFMGCKFQSPNTCFLIFFLIFRKVLAKTGLKLDVVVENSLELMIFLPLPSEVLPPHLTC